MPCNVARGQFTTQQFVAALMLHVLETDSKTRKSKNCAEIVRTPMLHCIRLLAKHYCTKNRRCESSRVTLPLKGFSYKKMHGRFAETKLSGRINEVTVRRGFSAIIPCQQ